MSSRRKPLRGSEFVPLEDAELAGAVDDDEPLVVTVIVRARGATALHHDDPLWEQSPQERRRLTAREGKVRWASEEDLERVKSFVEKHGLTVLDVSERRRAVRIRGTAHDLANAFGVELVHYKHAHGDHHGHVGPVHLPPELHEVVVAVLGLTNRPIASKHFSEVAADPPPAHLFPATELAEIYDFPRGFDGSGQKIGILQLSDKRLPAGYERSDLETFFSSLDLPMPQITDRALDGSGNFPESAADVASFMRWAASAAEGGGAQPPAKGRATAEVVMDIELVGALAPGAELIVYFAPNDEFGVYDALQSILEDGEVSVISFSWAWKEHGDGYEELIDEVLAQAADPASDRPPITFCAASGDYGGSLLCFPAASPWALGCGGTGLVSRSSGEARERVWNTRSEAASGGGVSRKPQPRWQQRAKQQSGRGVPDVAALADPASHCRIYAGGTWGPAAGTSAAAPIWAALIARINQALGPQGYVNPRLYGLAENRPEALRSVTEGDNIVKGEGFEAEAHWDPCTGLGTPRGSALLEALRSS